MRAHFLAKRFAAKEALVKALGTGFREGIQMRDIEVGHTPQGKPEFCLRGGALTQYERLGVTSSHLSISDEVSYAVAFVILESN